MPGFRANEEDVMAIVGHMTPDEAERILRRWVRELMRRCGTHVEKFRDGTMGLVNVPAKYVAAIDAMHLALFEVMQGAELPEFTIEEPKPRRKR